MPDERLEQPNRQPASCTEGAALGNEPRRFPSEHGTILYRAVISQPATVANFPTPQFRPRHRRPHSIHIISYPSGYIPRELRAQLGPRRSKALLSADSARKERRKAEKRAKKQEQEKAKDRDKERAESAVARSGNSNVLEKLLARFTSQPVPRSPTTNTPPPSGGCPPSHPSRRSVHLSNFGRRVSGLLDLDVNDLMFQSPIQAEALRPRSAAVQLISSPRNSFMSTRSAKSIMNSAVSELPEKPVASGTGMTCSILLSEPNVFLTGFDHDTRHTRLDSHNATALLRGKLQLNVTKNVKIKTVTLKLRGKARTEWPEGIPPKKELTSEEEVLRTQALTFFNAVHESWVTPYGNQCAYKIKTTEDFGEGITKPFTPTQSALSLALNAPNRQRGATSRDYKRLSLQSVQSRSFTKGESPLVKDVNKGYKVFYPGKYEYSFELPIDHHQLETAKLQYGSVKWELEALIDRAGAFKSNLHGSKEVNVVRVPDQMSLETSEPISISRQWEDQLHYDIMISGKSFPVGGRIPIAFKLTPLAKVHIHKIKVFATETIEYFTNNRNVTRKDPGRKILLLEKTAGRPLSKVYDQSEVRIISGGELSEEDRAAARRVADQRRVAEAARYNKPYQPVSRPQDNILGDLDLGLESFWAATEIEMNVQLPTCERMAKDKTVRLHPDCSWKNVSVYHWIKIVLRLSRRDTDDPTGQKRRHFEISIDSPFTVLNCRATQANTALPVYSGPQSASGYRQQSSCGCPDAEVLATDPSPASSSGTLNEPTASSALHNVALPILPQAAHLHTSTIGSPTPSRPGSSSEPLQHIRTRAAEQGPRPIHLIRYPSFDPPAFDADEPPPPLPADVAPTPPPQYDMVVGTPSVDGLGDYFARLADYQDRDEGALSDDSDDARYPARTVSRGGRVNIASPRTPGGRSIPSRSFDLERPYVNLSMDGMMVRRIDVAGGGQ